MRYKLNKWLGTILAICLLMSCGMVREGNRTKNSASTTTIVTVDTLAPALQRKYNYFFLEAVRMKTQQKYDAACYNIVYVSAPMLLQHCSNYRSFTWP